MINRTEIINVYNENDGRIFTVSQSDTSGYIFEPGTIEEPFYNPIPWEDIMFINNRSTVFKTGTLRFAPEEEDAIYKELRINPKQYCDYFTKADIDDCILEPTVEKLQSIVKVRSILTIEKFRNRLVVLDNEQQDDIAKRVYDVITRRYEELNRGIIRSNIVIKQRTKRVTKQEQLDREVQIGNVDSDKIDNKKVEETNEKKPTKATGGKKTTAPKTTK